LTELPPEGGNFFLKSADRLGIGRLPGGRGRGQERRQADRYELSQAVHVGTGCDFHVYWVC